MQHYIGVVYQNDDTAYGVHFPDLPGCFSAADDLQTLLSEAAEAVALYMEDQAERPARSMDAIRRAAKEDLDEGAFLIAVPHISLSGRSAKANITMDAGLLDAVDQTAKARGLTRSSFLADLARREITGL